MSVPADYSTVSWGGTVAPSPPPKDPFTLRTPKVVSGLRAVQLNYHNIALIAFRIVTFGVEGVYISGDRADLIVGDTHFKRGDWIVEERSHNVSTQKMRYRIATSAEIENYGFESAE